MKIKTLKELSFDTENKFHVANCHSGFVGYDLDGFVRENIKSNGYDYEEETKASVDAIVDENLLSSCIYVNFIEFKSGSIQLKSIRKKAIDSISLYGEYLDKCDMKSLPVNRRFLLIYKSRGGRDIKRRVRRIIQKLKDDLVIRECYDAGLKYHSGKEFEQNPSRYLN